jgi:Ca2+-binding RTX toxin-like protein
MSLLQSLTGLWSRKVRAHRRQLVNRLATDLEHLEARCLLASVLTYHNNLASTGVNAAETVLTRANVNSTTFGKVFTVSVDGDVYAQPVVKEDVNITVSPHAGLHDVVFVATQHGSVYAIDGSAQSNGQGVVLWKRSLLDIRLPGASSSTPVPRSDIGMGDPETSIMGTPTIDPVTNTLFVIARSREVVNGTPHFVQRIHALKLNDGTPRVAPVLIGDTVYHGAQSYTNNSPVFVFGTGDGNDGNGRIYFNALLANQRPALTLFNGVVYAAWASHGDRGPYHGWIVGFDAQTLQLRAVFNDTPNGRFGGIWQSGGGLSSDGTALYFETGNGTFDGSNGNLVTPSETGTVTGLNAQGFPVKGNYGNSFVKVVVDPITSATNQNVNGWGLKVADYFTPFNHQFLDGRDLDLGSGAPVILPDEVGSAAHPHLLVGAGKEGKMYVIDRDNMGKFGTKDNVVQTVAGQLSSSFDTAAYYQKKLYYVEGFGGTAKTFSIANGVMSSTPTSRSADTFTYAGSTPSVSANGNNNGIVWDVDRGTNQLRAYSSESYAQQLYHSGQAAGDRDRLGTAVTFQVPTIANGHVYLGTWGGTASTLVAYGLIQPPTKAPAAPSNLQALSISGTQVNLTWQANDTSPNIASGYVVQRSNDGGATWTSTPAGTATTFTIGGLQKSTTYKFRVNAINIIGASAFSNVLTVTTTAAAGGLDFSSGFTSTTAADALALNGAAISNGALVLTDGEPSRFQGVFSKVKQDITKFSTTFDFQINSGPSTNGFTFAIQSDNPEVDAIGFQSTGGESLAYGSLTQVAYPHSLAVKFDLFRSFDLYETTGEYISTTGVYLNGAMPVPPDDDMFPSGIDLHSGHAMTAVISYDLASRLVSLTVIDKVTKAQFNKTYSNIDLPAAVGGGSAYVGFTAASGRTASVSATQKILNWKFSPAGPPNAPANLHTTIGGQLPGQVDPPPLSVAVSWSSVPDATSYTIYRKFGVHGNYEVLATVDAPTTKYLDATVATQALYFYRVHASNGAGDSAASSEVLATTPGRVPTPRFGHAASVATNSITLAWRDEAVNEDGFNIFRRSGSSDYTLVVSLPAHPATGPMTFVDTGLTPGTPYDYHVQAFNLVGYSDFTGISTQTAALTAAPEANFRYVTTPRRSAVDAVSLQFSEPISGFAKDDLRLTRNGLNVALDAATVTRVNNRTFSIDLHAVTTQDGVYKLSLPAADSNIRDSANLALSNDAELSWRKETIAPKLISFTQVTPSPDVQLTSEPTLTYRMQFSEAVSAISVQPTLSFGLSAENPVVTTSDNRTFTITIGQLSGSGTLTLALNGATNPIRDVAGNVLPSSDYPASKSIAIDRTPPAVAIKKVLLEKGMSGTITAAQLLASDGRVGADAIVYKVTELPQHIAIKLGGASLQVGDAFTQLDINTLRLTFSHDNASALNDVFRFTITDGMNTTSVKTLPFSIVPFNFRPIMEPIETQETPRNTPLVIAGAQVTDADAGQTLLRMTISASFGRISLASAAGLTFSSGNGGLQTKIVFAGTLESINKALQGLQFFPMAAYVGKAVVNFEINDLGQGGTRVAKSSVRQAVVNVVPEALDATSLIVLGTSEDDTISVDVQPTQIVVWLADLRYVHSPGQIKNISVFAHDGNDHVTLINTGKLSFSLHGGDGNDDLNATSAAMPATLRGGRGNDILRGGSSGDSLIGGSESDRLIGGPGSDRYLFGNAGAVTETDTVVELANGGTDAFDFHDATDAIKVNLGSDSELAFQPGRKIITGGTGQFAHLEGIVGGSGNDVLRGNNAANYIYGGPGNDTLLGMGGNDKLFGQSGNDTLSGGAGNDALIGGTGNDRYLSGNVGGSISEIDTLTELASQGSDTLDFAGLTTSVTVDLGSNTLASQVNRQMVVSVAGQFANFENALGGSGDDTLRGNSAANTLVGNAGRDLLLGLGNADILRGGDGDDRLAGGDGFDQLFGNNGNDGFEFADVTSGKAEIDTVTEWAGDGDNDHLDFRGVTTPVTVNLNGNPLATHTLRTVVPGKSAELESVLTPPAAAPSSPSSMVTRQPTYPDQLDELLSTTDEDEQDLNTLFDLTD